MSLEPPDRVAPYLYKLLLLMRLRSEFEMNAGMIQIIHILSSEQIV